MKRASMICLLCIVFVFANISASLAVNVTVNDYSTILNSIPREGVKIDKPPDFVKYQSTGKSFFRGLSQFSGDYGGLKFIAYTINGILFQLEISPVSEGTVISQEVANDVLKVLESMYGLSKPVSKKSPAFPYFSHEWDLDQYALYFSGTPDKKAPIGVITFGTAR